MHNHNTCNKPVETLYLGQLPEDNDLTMPEYLLGGWKVYDQSSDNYDWKLKRVPTSKLFPYGTMDNMMALDANNEELEVPEGQVRAGYVQNTTGGSKMMYATTSNPAKFLMLGRDEGGWMMIQNTGFLHIPKGHQYIIGADYYMASDGSGEPVTDSASGVYLFTPLSTTTLAVNIRWS